MDKKIILQLAEWIDDQLELDLTLDNVALRSGYGKTQLQGKFKKIIGKNVMTYIRERRLCNAAIILMVTRMPVKDISEKFRFHSQQGFSTVFKKHFGASPSEFRRCKPDYSRFQVSPARRKESVFFYDSVEISDIFIDGVSRSLTMDIFSGLHEDAVSKKMHQQVRSAFGAGNKRRRNVYNIIRFSPSPGKSGHMDIRYCIGRKASKSAQVIPAGRYARAVYVGSWQGYVHFSRKVYSYVLPQLHLTRREGCDFDVYHCGLPGCDDSKGDIVVEYYVPVQELA